MNKCQLVVQKSLRDLKGTCLIVGVQQTSSWPAALKTLDSSLGGALKKYARKMEFKGEFGKTVRVSGVAKATFDHIVLFGLGKKKEWENDSFHSVGAKVMAHAKALKFTRCHIALVDEAPSARVLYSLVMGMQLANYSFDKYLKKKTKATRLDCQILVPTSKGASKLRAAIKRADAVAESVKTARDLVNEPPGILTPVELARRASSIARKNKLRVKVLNEKQIKAQKMNLFLSVGDGSTKNPPRFIHLSYLPKGRTTTKKVYLVGKGVTFDSGGLSLKPGGSMMTMKMDMAGSAAVIGAIECISKLKPDYEVHAVVAATENMPDGHATRPGDIVKAMNGTSVEILNTDAEGRLTLADAILYAKSKGATEIIDLATLTGACMIALGPITAGLYSNKNELAKNLNQAAENEAEHLWRMPLTKKLKRQIKSPIADLKNIGGSYGGSITAALFLQHFAGKEPWAHLDIAGPAWSEEDSGYIKKGGRGFAVATLCEYLQPLKE